VSGVRKDKIDNEIEQNHWWFDPGNYSHLKEFSPYDWIDQIAWRRLLYRNLQKSEENKFTAPRIEVLDEMYDRLMDNPNINIDINILSHQELESLSKSFVDYSTLDPVLFELLGEHRITRIAEYGDLTATLGDEITSDQYDYIFKLFKYFESKSRESDVITESHHKEFMALRKELVNKASWNNWPELPAVNTKDPDTTILVTLNLLHSDSAIIEDLMAKLPSMRKLTKTEGPLKKRRAPPYDSWRTSRTLEYIDLTLISMFYEHELSDNAAFKLLFPNEERDSSTFFKITKRNTKLFLSEEDDAWHLLAKVLGYSE
jgi:hypothetical protein